MLQAMHKSERNTPATMPSAGYVAVECEWSGVAMIDGKLTNV